LHLKEIGEAVAVGVGIVGIEIPMLASVLEARYLDVVEDLIAVAVGAERISTQDERLGAIAEAIAVGIGAGGVRAEESLLRVAQAVGVGIERVGGR